MVIFQILLLSDKRVISKERNIVRASSPRASLTWTDNTSKVGYACSDSFTWSLALEDSKRRYDTGDDQRQYEHLEHVQE